MIDAGVPYDGPMQMALDEALLRHRTHPCLRIFTWRQPQITFGYFGNPESIRAQFPGLPLTRRWTGGGIVVHDGDFTFSLVLPLGHPAAGLGGKVLYQKIHGAVAVALAENGREVVLSGAGHASAAMDCFQAPVCGDVVETGDGVFGQRKLAGGAIRKTRQGMLYQGSVRVPPDFRETFRSSLLIALADETKSSSLSQEELLAAEEMLRTKYGLDSWRNGVRQ